MRYVKAENLTNGMILGRPFLGDYGRLLLRKGAALNDTTIGLIKRLKYSGLYIIDEYSDGVEPNFIISDELRNNTVQALHQLMMNINMSADSAIPTSVNKVKDLVNTIVTDIINVDSAVINIIDLKSYDLYTYQHSVNVSVFAGVLGLSMGMNKTEIHNLVTAAMFHDIGKILIPKEVLNKPADLDDEEFEVIKKHPELGAKYLKDNLNMDATIYIPVRQHHEFHDGSGYAEGLVENQITLFARIIAIADVYDAITSNRVYHKAFAPHEACEYIMGNAGRHFHPDCVNHFVKTVAPYPVGITVLLSNGDEGIVVRNNTNFPMRPVIKIKPEPNKPYVFAKYVDLCHDPDMLDVVIAGIA